MKKIFLISLLISSVTVLSAQYWAPPGTVWHYEQTDFNPPIDDDFHRITSLGTALINGDTATALLEELVSFSDSESDTIYMKFAGNRVYYYHEPADAFKLLYDFNAEAGDTIWVFCRQDVDTLSAVVIDSVSSTIIAGDTLKVFHAIDPLFVHDCHMLGRIIERIGCVNYMFPLHAVATPPNGGYLRCYEDTIIGFSQFSIEPCEYIAVAGFEENSSSQDQFFAYPNPTDGIVFLETQNQIKSLRVFSTMGEMLLYSHSTGSFDISHLPNGIYIILIETHSGKTLYRKVVKAKNH